MAIAPSARKRALLGAGHGGHVVPARVGCQTRRRPSLSGCHRLHGNGNLLDVIGRRAAAAADEARTCRNEAARIRRHVLGRAQIQVATLDVSRPAGIRLRDEPRARQTCHVLNCFEHRGGPDRTVHADDIGARSFELGGESFRRRAIQTIAIRFRRDLGHDRKCGNAAYRTDCGVDLGQIAKRLEHEEIDTAIGKCQRLLAECLLGFGNTRPAPRFDTDAEGTD